MKVSNCTVANAKKKAGDIIGWAIANPAHDTAVFFRDQAICFSLCFCNLEKDEWSVNACHSFYLVIRCVNSRECETQKLRLIRNKPEQ